LHRSGLQQIQALALWHAFDHIDENDVRQFLVGNTQGTIGADVSGAYYGHFFTQESSFLEAPF
jgi:hypothetical protein